MADSSSGPKARILVVDDDAVARTFLETTLRNHGYEPVAAGSGAEALERARSQGPFPLALVDLVLPDIDGDEVARQLRAANPDLAIVYVTGWSNKLFTRQPMAAEDDAFLLEKPVSVQNLLRALSSVLGRRG